MNLCLKGIKRMSFKNLTIKELVILYHNNPVGDLREQLNNQFFCDADEYDTFIGTQVLIAVALAYNHNVLMFDILTEFVLDKLSTLKKYDVIPIDLTSTAISEDMDFLKKERVTCFMIGLYSYGGRCAKSFLPYFSEEYQMFVEL